MSDAPRIDLHTHTTASDGLLPPARLVRMAVDDGLRALALTDHDTVAGLPEARAEAGKHGLELVPGIEITSRGAGRELHILGYYFDPEDRAFQRFLAGCRRDRITRLYRIMDRLKEIGIELDPTEVMPDPDKAGTFGRPHIARALIEHKHAGGIHDAFRRFLGKDARCYVPRRWVDVTEVIRVIRAAGGLPVLAHPGKIDKDALIAELKDHGLAGIELHHPEHNEHRVTHYRKLADRLGILATGGSDYHGQQSVRHGGLGWPGCETEDFERLKAAAGR